jgi:predicted nucleotidyltransferase
MDKIDDTILESVKNFYNALKKKIKVDQIYLYGSYAEGTNNEWSDIDLAVVVDDDTNSYSREIFSMAKDYDTRFDALGFKIRDFELSLLPVIPEIKRNSIKLL